MWNICINKNGEEQSICTVNTRDIRGVVAFMKAKFGEDYVYSKWDDMKSPTYSLYDSKGIQYIAYKYN